MDRDEATKALRILDGEANFIVAASLSEVINLEAARGGGACAGKSAKAAARICVREGRKGMQRMMDGVVYRRKSSFRIK